MSFFAVLRHGQDTFHVENCHLNLWCLGALGPRRTFALDVGLFVKAGEAELAQLQVAIPFGSDRVRDLARHVLDPRIAELIFDAEVTLPRTSTIALEGKQWPVARISPSQSKLETGYSERTFSLWTIELATPILAGETAYLRMRFGVTATGRTWQWQRFLGARAGALVDLRVCDVRSAATVAAGEELRGRMLPIQHLAAFVITPAWLHQRAVSPVPKYVRLLEGPVWSTYLERAPELRGRSRLVVFYWRNRKTGPDGSVDVPVSQDKPFRAFLDLEMERRPLPLLPVAATALLAAVLVGLAYRLSVRSWVRGAPGWVLDGLQALPAVLSLTSVGAIVVFVLAKRIPAIAEVLRWLWLRFLRAETLLFRKLSK